MKKRSKKAEAFTLENPEPPANETQAIIKQRATPSAVRQLANIQALHDAATTDGERQSASAAMDRLRERWDFDNPIEVKTRDIFADLIPATVDGYASEVMRFTNAESVVASFTQWAIENGFSLRARIRRIDNEISALAVEAQAAHVPRLQALAATIRGGFFQLWQEFRRIAVCDERDATIFFRGCYDGMLRDQRKAGEALPVRYAAVKRNRLKGKAIVTNGVQLHPYSVGCDMGAKIRMQTPIDELAVEIRSLAEKAAA